MANMSSFISFLEVRGKEMTKWFLKMEISGIWPMYVFFFNSVVISRKPRRCISYQTNVECLFGLLYGFCRSYIGIKFRSK